MDHSAKTFNLYVKDFGISIEDLKNKSALDIGCGHDALFVKYGLQKGINVVGMDTQESDNTDTELLKDRYVQGSIHNIPFVVNSFDMIFMRAVPVGDYDDIKKVADLLKPGGELKIAPLYLDTNDEEKSKIDGLISSLGTEQFEATKEVREIQKLGNNEYPRYLLTIKRK